ncbi:MAG: hypothetical protein ABI970_17860 [Chloroflexota bacterium]
MYEREKEKYVGRESVVEYRIPLLDAGWGDTVNLSTLDPRRLVAVRRQLGVPFSQLLMRRLVCIPVERIVGLPAVRYSSTSYWLNSSPGDRNVPVTPPDHEFSVFDPAQYQETDEVPSLHVDYLRQQLALGKRALGFVFVPHVLVASPIDLQGLNIVDL